MKILRFSFIGFRTALVALLALAASSVVKGRIPALAADPAWTTTGSMGTRRVLHTATLLQDGKVLVAGGLDDDFLASAELYNPAAGGWTATGSMSERRGAHRATLLPDGTVLVVGGVGSDYLASAERYHPGSGMWSTAGSSTKAGYAHTATLMPNGKVLVAGGTIGSETYARADLYDPVTNSWTSAASMPTRRAFHTATLLQDGRVLVVGGFDGGVNPVSVLLYDPAANAWSSAADMPAPRTFHTATLLQDGRVLVAGGGDLPDTLLYDPPPANTWSAGGDMNTRRAANTATLLANGKVLAAGGDDFLNGLASAELFEPATGTWSLTESMNDVRDAPSATLLQDGRVLVAGGFGAQNDGLASAELFSVTDVARIWVGVRNSDDVGTRFDLRAEVFKNGTLLGLGQVDGVLGGGSGFGKAVVSAVPVLPAPLTLSPGETLSITISVRVGATGHRSGTARLWFNDSQADSRFDATINGVEYTFHLRDGSVLGTSPGPGPKKTIDVFVDRAVGGNPFKAFGTWSKTF